MPRSRLLSLLTVGILLIAGTAAAQEVRVAPREQSALRQWDARVDADYRAGTLRRRNVRPDPLLPGRSHERFDQFVRGVRVYGADITRQLDAAGQTVSLFGTIYDGIDLPVVPSLTQADAKRRVEALGGARLGESRQPELVVLPLDQGGFALTWYARIVSPATGTLTAYFLDAHTGAVVASRNDVKTQSAVGRGTGVLGDTKKMSVMPNGGTHYALDMLRPPDIATFDMKGNVARVIDFINGAIALGLNDIAVDTDNTWTDAAAVDAHTHAGYTYDYLFARFNRRGLDDRDVRILSLVHPVRRNDVFTAPGTILGLFYVNASYWGEGVMVYGEGLPPGVTFDNQSWDYTSGALDIVAHELGHGVTEYTSDLVYQNESGALNESFSDILGASVEFYFQPRGNGPMRSDWLIGEDVIRPGGLRNMANPAQLGYPDHYDVRFTGSADNGGVHINSAIPNLAFVLAIEGGPHPRTGAAVEGVGFANREQIERVFYRAFTQLMPASANFRQARTITLQAARDLYGAGSAPERALAQAWTAVGVR